jgi:hypothetical protein
LRPFVRSQLKSQLAFGLARFVHDAIGKRYDHQWVIFVPRGPNTNEKKAEISN